MLVLPLFPQPHDLERDDRSATVPVARADILASGCLAFRYTLTEHSVNYTYSSLANVRKPGKVTDRLMGSPRRQTRRSS
jgi:hypothetical protein